MMEARAVDESHDVISTSHWHSQPDRARTVRPTQHYHHWYPGLAPTVCLKSSNAPEQPASTLFLIHRPTVHDTCFNLLILGTGASGQLTRFSPVRRSRGCGLHAA